MDLGRQNFVNYSCHRKADRGPLNLFIKLETALHELRPCDSNSIKCLDDQ